MGIYWSSPSSQRRTPRRAMVTRNRRRVASHRDAWTSAGSVPVEFSEWRDVLEALRSLPPIAAEGCCSSSVGRGLPAPSAANHRGVSSVDTPSPLLPTGDTPPTHRKADLA